MPNDVRRRQKLGMYGQVQRYVAAVSAGLWSAAAQMVHQRSHNSTIYARRLKYLQLSLTGLRGPHAAELTAAAAVPWINGAAVVHPPSTAPSQLESAPVIAAVFCISPSVHMPTGEPRLFDAFEHARATIRRTNWEGAIDGWLRVAYYSSKSQLIDEVRGNQRVGFGIPELTTCGHKDFKGVPREPLAEGGMYYPRMAAQHFFMGGAALLNEVLCP